MLFESRKVLIGFRVKLNFDASLEKDNSFVFINLSETPTIQDLLSTIRRRFEITKDIYIALDDCRLLNSEDNSVLIDVHEIKIMPCKFETSIVPSKYAVPPCDLSFKSDDIAQTVESNEASNKNEGISTFVEEITSIKKKNDNVFCVKEVNNRNCKRFYSSIAETIRYLNQNYKPEMSELENEIVPVLPNVATLEIEDRKKEEKMNAGAMKKEYGVENVDDASFENISDECVEKRKRKRKRKYSKKTKPECDRSEIIQNIHDERIDSSMEINTDNLRIKSTRQHIFFNVDNDDNTQDDQHPAESNVVIDSSSRIRACNKKARKLENVAENVKNGAVNMNGIADITDNGCLRLTDDEDFEKKSVALDSVNGSNAVSCNMFFESETKFASKGENSYVKSLVSEDPDLLLANNAKYRTLFEKSTDWQSKVSLNNSFFSTFNATPNNRHHFQTKEFPSENAHPLSTLLMCKQLQTPVEYNVQFAPSRNRSNSCISVASKKSLPNSSIIDPDSVILMDNGDENSNGDDECEVLCQYKIVRDKVLIRNSNGTWNILSEEEASLKLQPVEEPLENQSITFQLLYLGPDMCPSMSDLICGKVISFQKDSGKLVVNILPAFIDTLLKSFREDACLPDELVHITENTYQVLWIAVKNPRLLM